MRPFRIAILGHYHGSNLGDDAIVGATIRELRRRLPGVSLVGISLRPEDTARRHGIDAIALRSASEKPRPAGAGGPRPERQGGLARFVRRYPRLRALVRSIRRLPGILSEIAAEPGFLRRSLRRLDGVDLVVVAGSNPLSDDWAGAWSHPYTLLKWALLARRAGARFAFAAVGAGPVDGRLAARFLRWTLLLACYSSVRDLPSAELVAQLTGQRAPRVFPDLAFSTDELPQPAPAAQRVPVVGLGILPYHDPRYWPDAEPQRDAIFTAKMTEFAAALLRRGQRVLVVPTQVNADPRVAKDVRDRLSAQGLALEDADGAAHIKTQEALFERIAACDVVVTGRFHGVIFSALLGKPVIALAYHPKTWELMRSLGIEAYCLDIDRFQPADLLADLERLSSNADEIRKRMAEQVAANRLQLSELYDELLAAGLGA